MNQSLAEKAVGSMVSVLVAADVDLFKAYFSNIVDAIKEANNSFTVMKIAYQYFKDKVAKDATKEMATTLLIELESEYKVMDLLINDLQRYSELVKTMVDDKVQEGLANNKPVERGKLQDEVFEEKFYHSE